MVATESEVTPEVFPIGPDDDELLRACGEIHRSEIPEGFLSSLGVPFLTEMYRAIALEPATFLFGSTAGDSLEGLICGSEGGLSPIRLVLKMSPWRVLRHAGPRLAQPANFLRAVETLRYMGADPSTVDLPPSEILNFAVSRSSQGKGVGQLLFRELCREFKARGVGNIRIVTGADQRSAQRFYESAGARRAGSLTVHEGTDSVVYVYELN